MAPNVLLLRGSLDPDPYHRELASLGYNTRSIPPLDTTLVHQDELRHRMSETASVHAVVLTSARSADAWRDALVALHDANVDAPVLGSWQALPFYVVGSATATALTAPDAVRPNLPLPVDIRGAAETGTSTRLAELIVEDLAGVHCEMLYLVGDKNSDVLPEILKKAGIQLQTLQVYATCGSPTFVDDLRSLVEEVGTIDRWWIVFFAPSSSSYVLPFLREHFSLSASSTQSSVSACTMASVAAIGPTTQTHLKDVLGLHVHVVSPKPSAHDLAVVLHAHDAQQNLAPV